MATSLQVIEGDGPEPTVSKYVLPERIIESSPSRNRTLYGYGCSLRAHGWDHQQIMKELRKVNQERCIPPMQDSEVRTVARSAAAHEVGNASYVAPEVLEAVAYLEEKARNRTAKGLGGRSRWAVYRALLDTARAHGQIHQNRDVAVSISVRDLALASGLSLPTAHKSLKALQESNLVYRSSSGEGSKAGSLVLRSSPAKGTRFIHSNHHVPLGGESHEDKQALYALRHGAGRLGKTAGAVMEMLVENPGIRREELAVKMNRKAESLKRPLRKLKDAGLIENEVRGRYKAVKDWQKVLDRELTFSGEKLAENLDRAAYGREREAYRLRLAQKKGAR